MMMHGVHGVTAYVKCVELCCCACVQVVQIFQQHHHTCCLYLGSVLVDEYGDERTFVPPLLDMLQVDTTSG